MNLNKDIYEYLLYFVDDFTVVSMLSVNRKFYKEKLYEQLMLKRYPFLYNLKKRGYIIKNKKQLPFYAQDSWKLFFIKMTYYMNKLEKEYNISYIPCKTFVPRDFYLRFTRVPEIQDFALQYACYSGKLNIVKQLISNGARVSTVPINAVMNSGNPAIIKLFQKY